MSLGKAVAGLNAQAKGRALGIFETRPQTIHQARQRKRGEEFWVKLCGRPVPAKNTDRGVRAVSGDKPIDPDAVAEYLSQKFGDNIEPARTAMEALAKAFEPNQLPEWAFILYQRFRPEIPGDKTGWGVKGTLDLRLIRSLAKSE